MKKAAPHPRYRALFESTWNALAKAEAERRTFGRTHPLNDELGEALQAAMKAAKSRKKIKITGKHMTVHSPRWDLKKAEHVLGSERYQEIYAPFAKRAKALMRSNEKRTEALKARLRKLAPLVPLEGTRTTQEGRLVEEVWSSTYSTQPNRVRYAEARAEIHMEHLVEICAPVEFFLTRRTWGSQGSTIVFELRGHLVDDTEVNAVRNLPPPPMPTFVRKCWAKGVNPRVYLPLLPLGYESEHGFDEFGRDT